MVETEVIWQQRLDKQNKLIAAYKALYSAQEKELAKLEVDSFQYCSMYINQLQLADEIEAKEMFAERIVKDREQQLLIADKKREYVDKHSLAVINKLKEKRSSPLVKGNEKTHYQALLKQVNTLDGDEYVNAVFNAATALGMVE